MVVAAAGVFLEIIACDFKAFSQLRRHRGGVEALGNYSTVNRGQTVGLPGEAR